MTIPSLQQGKSCDRSGGDSRGIVTGLGTLGDPRSTRKGELGNGCASNLRNRTRRGNFKHRYGGTNRVALAEVVVSQELFEGSLLLQVRSINRIDLSVTSSNPTV